MREEWVAIRRQDFGQVTDEVLDFRVFNPTYALGFRVTGASKNGCSNRLFGRRVLDWQPN